MEDNKLQWLSMGLERFSHLEDKIFQAVEEIKSIRKETESLRGENYRLNEQINEKVREAEGLRGEIARLTHAAEESEKLLIENDNFRQQIATMRQTETETLDLLAQFEKEREELRGRVEKTLSLLASLDVH
jgi:FtsZ-binding cell division protein ZapB